MSDYRVERGHLVRIKPRQFRRGRIQWKEGQVVRPIRRYKFWTLGHGQGKPARLGRARRGQRKSTHA